MYLIEFVNRELIARAMGLGEWDCRVTATMRDVRAKQLELEEKRAELVGRETLRETKDNQGRTTKGDKPRKQTGCFLIFFSHKKTIQWP